MDCSGVFLVVIWHARKEVLKIGMRGERGEGEGREGEK
jgi:hypothetical protein